MSVTELQTGGGGVHFTPEPFYSAYILDLIMYICFNTQLSINVFFHCFNSVCYAHVQEMRSVSQV